MSSLQEVVGQRRAQHKEWISVETLQKIKSRKKEEERKGYGQLYHNIEDRSTKRVQSNQSRSLEECKKIQTVMWEP